MCANQGFRHLVPTINTCAFFLVESIAWAQDWTTSKTSIQRRSSLLRYISFLDEEINHVMDRHGKLRSGFGRLNLDAFDCKLKLLKLRMGKFHFLLKPKIHVPGHVCCFSWHVGRDFHAYVRVCTSTCMQPACIAARPLPTWIANFISLEARLIYHALCVTTDLGYIWCLSCLPSFYQPCCHRCGQGCNVRHEHTFVDEDAMGWLKRCMAAQHCFRKSC